MSKPQTCNNGTNGREDQNCSEPVQTKCNADFVKKSIRRFGGAFCELEWHDRLSLVLATVLGLALVLVLSPILLISWVCLLLAKQRIPRPNKLALRSRQP